jgi:hypothetical protein
LGAASTKSFASLFFLSSVSANLKSRLNEHSDFGLM